MRALAGFMLFWVSAAGQQGQAPVVADVNVSADDLRAQPSGATGLPITATTPGVATVACTKSLPQMSRSSAHRGFSILPIPRGWKLRP